MKQPGESRKAAEGVILSGKRIGCGPRSGKPHDGTDEAIEAIRVSFR